MEETGRIMACEWRDPRIYPLHALINDLSHAIARTEMHIRVDPASRLHGWVRELTNFQRTTCRGVAIQITETIRANLQTGREDGPWTDDGQPDPDSVWRFPYQDAFRILLEARMFVHVVRHLENKLNPLHWKALVQGNLRPEADRENTPHRDYLLELYVASAAEAAGMNVELGEPDVLVHVAGQRLGIAVKRIKSRKQVLENAKKGARQIAREVESAQIERGLVFLDVSNVMNGNMAAMRYLREFGKKDSGTVHGHLMKFASEAVSIQQFLGEPHVEGIILRHAVPAMLARSFIPATLETWSPIVDQPSSLTMALYGGMLDALSPPFNPQPGMGPSGWAPCEFSYAHPW